MGNIITIDSETGDKTTRPAVEGVDYPSPAQAAAEMEVEVQALVDQLTDGADRDKAMAMVIADVVAKAFNISTAQARQMVRDRFVDHLRTIKGL